MLRTSSSHPISHTQREEVRTTRFDVTEAGWLVVVVVVVVVEGGGGG